MRKLVLCLSALLLVGGASLAAYVMQDKVSIADDWTSSDPPVTNRRPCSGIKGGPYPDRIARTLVLPPRDKNIRFGYDCYADDMLMETHFEYRNGMQEIIRYHFDRIVSERTLYYATVNGDLGRVRSHAVYAADGVTFKSHEVYRGDGTLERVGARERDGRYIQRYFYEDGTSPERLRVFNAKLEFVSEKQYRRDGSEIAGIVVTTDQLELGVTLYAPDGNRTASFYRTKMGEKGYVFDSDGNTMLEYAFDPYFSVSGHFDRKGRLMQKREARFNREVISFLSRDQTRTYTQVRRQGDNPALRTVDEEDFATKQPIRRIEMNKPGDKVAKVIYPRADGGKDVRNLDDDGNVVGIDHFDQAGKQTGSETVSRPQKEVIPQEALLVPEPSAPEPGFRLFGPPLVYDYETEAR